MQSIVLHHICSCMRTCVYWQYRLSTVRFARSAALYDQVFLLRIVPRHVEHKRAEMRRGRVWLVLLPFHTHSDWMLDDLHILLHSSTCKHICISLSVLCASFPTHLTPPHLLFSQCDKYLVVMDKVEVLDVEVVSPGHRSHGDRSKDRVPFPPSISPP